MAKRICPKCNLGEMYATGGGYNYCCPLCGHTYHESRPRPHISSGPTREMEDATRELEENLRELRRINGQYEEWKWEQRAEKRRREYEKRERKAQKAQQKREKRKGISLGTIIGIIFVLWLLSQFFS